MYRNAMRPLRLQRGPLPHTPRARWEFSESSKNWTRYYVSECFQIQKHGMPMPVDFVSKKTDADVLLALKDVESDFARNLLCAGQAGRWSGKMRAWAHYLAQERSSQSMTEGQESQGVVEDKSEGEVLVRIDSRERKLIELIRHKGSFPVSVETLRVADVIIGAPPYEIFVERKSMRDLYTSIFDTRLHNQLGNKLFASDYERFRTVMVIEGGLSVLKLDCIPERSYEIKRRLVQATMVRLSIRDQIPVLRSDDVAGTLELIHILAKEHPKLISSRPQQYAARIDKPFRPRRGEDPKEVLADQLRCVRGVSRRAAQQLATGYTHINAFLTDMVGAEDPVQWLMDRSTAKDGDSMNRPAAVLLAEALAGPEAIAREDMVRSLVSVDGLSRQTATELAARFGSMETLSSYFQESDDPVVAAGIAAPQLSHPARCSLVAQVVGEEALTFERHKQKISGIAGISTAVASSLANRFKDAATLCQALLSDPSAPEPVGRAIALTGLKRLAARRLVSIFIDDKGAHDWDDLVQLVAGVKGISERSACCIVASIGGDIDRLREAAENDAASEQPGCSQLTGLRPRIAMELCKALRKTDPTDWCPGNRPTIVARDTGSCDTVDHFDVAIDGIHIS